jgi:hypothetical protein
MAEVPSNSYGRLNRWNPARSSQHNPGGRFSIFHENGTLRIDNNNNNNNFEIEYTDFLNRTHIPLSPLQWAVMVHDEPNELRRLYNAPPPGLPPLDVVPEPLPGAAAEPPPGAAAEVVAPRRSARLASRYPKPSSPPRARWSPDQRCDGETCPITSEIINGNGIKLSDGHCYSADGILHWYKIQRSTPKTTPMRAPYTERDRKKIRAYQQFSQTHLNVNINATNSPYELSPSENFTRRRKHTAKGLLELQKRIKSRKHKTSKSKRASSSSSSKSKRTRRS